MKLSSNVIVTTTVTLQLLVVWPTSTTHGFVVPSGMVGPSNNKNAMRTTSKTPTASKSFTSFTSSSSSSSSSSSTTTTRTTTRLWANGMDPLAQEGDWAAYLDEATTGLVYYFNLSTGESLWEPPTKTFPKVSLDPKLRVVAQRKQMEYQSNVGGTLILDNDTNQVTTTSESKQRKGFFGFGKSKQESNENLVTVQDLLQDDESDNKKNSGGFFGFGGAAAAGKKKDFDPIAAAAQSIVEQQEQQDAATSKSGGGGGFMKSFFGSSEETMSTTTTVEETPVTTSTTTTTTTVAPSTISIDMSAYVLPHPAKVRWGGEDAVFVKGRTFGVFDGVSGAEKLDGVPLYSVTLAKELKAMVNSKETLSVQQITNVLTEAAEFADRSATGASTAVVGSLSEDGLLEVLNVGDSLCMVIREGKVVAKTKDIVHYFDCPYQLSEDSPDRPRDGTKLKTKILPGDVILAGSDGIFDNLTEEEICNMVTSNRARASTLARKVVDRSRRVSLDSTAQTPYAKLAKKNGDPDYKDGVGGKVDDVSCVVVKCM